MKYTHANGVILCDGLPMSVEEAVKALNAAHQAKEQWSHYRDQSYKASREMVTKSGYYKKFMG